MGAKFYLKIFAALFAALFLGYLLVDAYLGYVRYVQKSKHRIKLIKKFENRTNDADATLENDEAPLVKVSLKLENLMKEEFEPKDDKNIFFIDSSHVLANPPKTVNPRQLCSYESAAIAHPTLQVYVVFVSLHKSMTLEMTKALNALLSYKNVNIVFVRFTHLARGTPGEDFMASGVLENSNYPVEHTSDVFRLLLLWRYGGFYLDSDMIVKKSLTQLGTNFACAEGEQDIISNALLSFDHENGRELLETFIRDQIENFNETAWSFNGPQSVSRVVLDLCGELDTNKIKKVKTCGDFRIHPRKLCYPILPTHYEKIFLKNYTKGLMRRTKNAITVHLWNRLTRDITTTKSERNLYTFLARNFCPKVFKAIDTDAF